MLDNKDINVNIDADDVDDVNDDDDVIMLSLT